MVSRWMVVAALIGYSGSSPATAAEPVYDVRGPAIRSGFAFHLTGKAVSKDMRLTVATAGVPQSIMTFDVEQKYEARYVVESAEDRRMTKLRCRVVNGETTFTTRLGEQEDIRHTVDSLVGREIISEFGDKIWKHRLAAGEPTEDEAASLEQQLGFSDEGWYPKEKVAIGATWDVPPIVFGQGFARTAPVELKGQTKAKLVGLREFEGESCAVIRIQGPVRGTFHDDDGPVTLELEIDATEYRSLRSHVSRRIEIRAEINMSKSLKMGDEKREESVEGTVETTYLMKESK